MLNGLYGYIFRQKSEEHPQQQQNEHESQHRSAVVADGSVIIDDCTTGNKPVTNGITCGGDDEWILVDDCKSSGRSSPVLVAAPDIMESSNMQDFLDTDDAASQASAQLAQQNHRHQLKQTRMLAAQRRAVSEVMHAGAVINQPSTMMAKSTTSSGDAVARELTQGKMKRANQVVKAERKTKPRSMRVKQLVANRNNDRKCQY